MSLCELLARGSVWREHTTHSRGIPVSAAKRLPAALHAEVVSLRSRIIPAVVQQHVGDAIHLHGTRTLLAEAPHVTLAHLRRFDDRLAAHLAGLAVAGEHAISVCTAALDAAIPSSMFVAAVRALEDGRREWFTRLLAMSMGVEPFRTGFSSALGWLGPTHLRGIVADILGSPHAIARCLGVAACAIHRVDPGLVSANLLLDEDAAVRARAFRAAGETRVGENWSRCAEPPQRPTKIRSAISGQRGRPCCLVTGKGPLTFWPPQRLETHRTQHGHARSLCSRWLRMQRTRF